MPPSETEAVIDLTTTTNSTTAMMTMTAEALTVAVLGQHRLSCDLTEALLRANGAHVVDVTTAEEAQVIALVEPDGETWRGAMAIGVPIVLITEHELMGEDLAEAIRRGARGTVHPDAGVGEFLRAMALVAKGDTALTRAQTASLVDAIQSAGREALDLTPREVDILRSIDRGESVKQTGRALGISAKTVENLQSRLFRKLGVRNRAQAVARAHVLGLLDKEIAG